MDVAFKMLNTVPKIGMGKKQTKDHSHMLTMHTYQKRGSVFIHSKTWGKGNAFDVEFIFYNYSLGKTAAGLKWKILPSQKLPYTQSKRKFHNAANWLCINDMTCYILQTCESQAN